MTLLLNLWWIARAGRLPLEGERFAPPFTEADWRRCLELVTKLEETGRASRAVALAFLRALCLFSSGPWVRRLTSLAQSSANRLFIRGRRRIVRTYVVSEADGQARLFHGTIAHLTNDGRKGQVYVEELRRNIPFIANDFSLIEAQRGDVLGPFAIAFNYLGPVADPAGASRRTRAH